MWEGVKKVNVERTSLEFGSIHRDGFGVQSVQTLGTVFVSVISKKSQNSRTIVNFLELLLYHL